MERSITLDEALRRTIDANIYFLPDAKRQSSESLQEFCMAIGLPFTRPDEKWEFRFLILHASRIDRSGEWDEDALIGWGIERVTISPNTIEFGGDEVAIKIELLSSAGGFVGAVARVYLDQWPNSDSSEFSSELSTLFTDRKLEWHDLLAPITTHEYR